MLPLSRGNRHWCLQAVVNAQVSGDGAGHNMGEFTQGVVDVGLIYKGGWPVEHFAANQKAQYRVYAKQQCTIVRCLCFGCKPVQVFRPGGFVVVIRYLVKGRLAVAFPGSMNVGKELLAG